MLLKKRVEAGVLIYALLMAAIFVLLLEFYLDRVVASHRQVQALKNNSQSYLIAQIVEKEKTDSSGKVIFNQGEASYQRNGSNLTVIVKMTDGSDYTYDFARTDSASRSDKKKNGKSKPSASTDDKTKNSNLDESSNAESEVSR
ncbi:competence type IV pilus minor pilin ComGG [Streptococcus dentapri]|uniref:Competence type IV pilus minor pilin ComGG n=1 Tax=Streptococcus dentapri TaxID=573564 RepID=A0ABV8D2A2_9STRE